MVGDFCFDFVVYPYMVGDFAGKGKNQISILSLIQAINNNLVYLEINKVRPKINQLINRSNNLV